MSEHHPPDVGETRAASIANKIVAASLQQKLLVGVMTLILVCAGIWSVQRLPMDAYPDLSPPMVDIVTQWPGHTAEEVERLITVPVERGMNGIPHTSVSRSVSLYGLSDVTLTFENGTDNYFARQQVFNDLPGVSLPSGVTPSVSPMSAPSNLIYRYVLESPDRSAMGQTFEDWIVQPAYKSVPGVADDSGFGGGDMQYQVLLDPTKVAGIGLSVSQVEAALAANNSNGGGGFYQQGGQFYYVQGNGRIKTTDDIGNIVLAVNNAVTVLVKDVGHVEIGIAPRLGEFGYEKTNDAVEHRADAHRREDAECAEGHRSEDGRAEQPGAAEGCEDPSLLRPLRSYPSHPIHRGREPPARHGSRDRGAVFFLYDIRAGLIVAATIPLSLLFAFICLDIQGASANLLSIRADFGIWSMARFFMVENIYRQISLREGPAVRRNGSNPRRRRGSGSPAVLCGGRDRRDLPARWMTSPALGTLCHAGGRHDDLRAGRIACRNGHLAAGVVRLVHAQGHA